MRGMLSFMILWILSKGERYGQEIALELAKRRGGKPNPGTLYPALKELEAKGVVSSRTQGRRRYYSLTEEGRGELDTACAYFCRAFGEIVNEYEVSPKGG
jgi:DNA-binding PadR family transcriptional regulator